VASQLDRRLEDGELVGPGREAAAPLEGVELAEHGDHRLVRGQRDDILDLRRADHRTQSGHAPHLEPGPAQQQCVQPPQRVIPRRPAAGQLRDPVLAGRGCPGDLARGRVIVADLGHG
jgi:hypothetical protein